MNPAKREEASRFQFCVLYGCCSGQCLLRIRQGLCRTFPHDGCDQGQIPRCFGQRPLILIDLSYLQGLFKIATCLWLLVCLLDGQDCQTVERLADESRVCFLLRLREQLFIGRLGLFPGVLERIHSSQMRIEVFNLPGRKLNLEVF